MSHKILKKTEVATVAFERPHFASLSNISAAPDESAHRVFPDISKLGPVVLAKNLANDNRTAAQVLADARIEADQLIAVANARGAEIGEEIKSSAMIEFEETVASEVELKIGDLRNDFADSLQKISDIEDEITHRIERDLVGLALAIAKKIIGREVTADREIVVSMLNNALEKLRERSIAEVHLNPEDLKFIESNRDQIKFRGSLELIPDPSISIGGCLIHTDTGDIDARIDSQFEELAHGLLDS